MKKKLFLIQVLFLSLTSSAQPLFLLKDPGSKSILLNNGWTYSMQDHADALLPAFNDDTWKPIQPAADIHDSMPVDAQHGVGIMRLKFRVEDRLRNQQLALIVHQSIASEIYLNGKLVQVYGVVSNKPDEVKAFDPLWKPVPVYLSADSIQVLAVRFAAQPGIRFTTIYGTTNPILSMEILSNTNALQVYKNANDSGTGAFFLGLYLMLFIFHLFFYMMYPQQKANLFLSLFAFCTITGGIIQIFYYLNYAGDYYLFEPEDKFFVGNLSIFLMVGLSNLMLFMSVHRFLKRKPDFYLKTLPVLLVIGMALSVGIYDSGWMIGMGNFPILTMFAVLLVSIDALRKNTPGAKVFIAGSAISLLFFTMFFLSATVSRVGYHHLRQENHTVLFMLFSFYVLGLPAAISLFLAHEFASTSKRLEQKLQEVESLSEENIRAEKEKQEMLASQNILLEQKVTQRTEALTQSLQDLKSAQAQLIQSEKMASLGELTAGIAHEIQNPLNFVNNFSEVNEELIGEAVEAIGNRQEAIEKSPMVIELLNNIKENLTKINHHGKRADAIVKGMLQHSQAGSGQKEMIDINTFAEEYLRLALHGMRGKDNTFTVNTTLDFDPAIGKISVVPQDISRVLLNLYTNAFYALTEKKKILKEFVPVLNVSTIKKIGCIEIRVKDNGNGIPKKIQDKIFQPFFTTKPTGLGTGLGLSIAWDIIVKGHGGKIGFLTEEDVGTEFIITLDQSN